MNPDVHRVVSHLHYSAFFQHLGGSGGHTKMFMDRGTLKGGVHTLNDNIMSSKELSLKQAREVFESLISRVKKREEFIDWIHSTYCEGEDCEKPLFVTDAIKKLKDIAEHIKTRVPDGSVKSEQIRWPTSGHDADCAERNTVHVDCFLYDDYAMEQMIKTGKLQRRYCVDCGSRNVKDLNFISHSMAHCQNVNVVHADIRTKDDLVSQADMIIMNNVFSFFMDSDEQA
ncbi:hypothetical protein ANCDUO_18672 [Ancylostoma duodenale]|uniref:Uncharacterized protein n=1 Tax=Ancylostoma duodenale TaxID=51022 RepID=A0A0C2C4M2_9BILA|nr:hypothetical protein ANCDUO_18672 [Ancylostoma duodenale]